MTSSLHISCYNQGLLQNSYSFKCTYINDCSKKFFCFETYFYSFAKRFSVAKELCFKIASILPFYKENFLWCVWSHDGSVLGLKIKQLSVFKNCHQILYLRLLLQKTRAQKRRLFLHNKSPVKKRKNVLLLFSNV